MSQGSYRYLSSDALPSGKIMESDGSGNWSAIDTPGGGGGSSNNRTIIQVTFDGDGAPNADEYFNNLRVTPMPAGADTSRRFNWVVPGNYTATDQIFVRITGFCESSGNLRMVCTAALYEPSGTDGDVEPPTNVNTNSQTIGAPGTATNFFADQALEVTNASGQINSIALAAGDILSIDVQREGSNVLDTVTGDFKNATLEVIYG